MLAVLIVLAALAALLAALTRLLTAALLLLARLLSAALLAAALLATLLATLLLLTWTLIRILILAHFASFRCWCRSKVHLRCSPAQRLGQRSASGLVPARAFRDCGGTTRNTCEFSCQRNKQQRDDRHGTLSFAVAAWHTASASTADLGLRRAALTRRFAEKRACTQALAVRRPVAALPPRGPSARLPISAASAKTGVSPTFVFASYRVNNAARGVAGLAMPC
jgi:hypothetical protein